MRETTDKKKEFTWELPEGYECDWYNVEDGPPEYALKPMKYFLKKNEKDD